MALLSNKTPLNLLLLLLQADLRGPSISVKKEYTLFIALNHPKTMGSHVSESKEYKMSVSGNLGIAHIPVATL